MARICGAIEPRCLEEAYVVMYAGGTSTAQSRINIADIVSTNRTSWKPRQSSASLALLVRGGQDLSKKVPRRKHDAVRSAKQRIVQEKPIWWMREENRMGYRTPPKPPAVVARPVARARWWVKERPRVAILVVHKIEEDAPHKKPNASMN